MKKKDRDIIPFAVLSLFILIFAVLALIAAYGNTVLFVSLLILFILLVIGTVVLYKKIDYAEDRRENSFQLIIIMAFTALFTWFLNNVLAFGLVISSVLIGLISSLIPYFWKSEFAKKLPTAVYCATFVGMTSSLVLDHWLPVYLAGVLSGIIYIWTRKVFVGVGGKLGVMACLSVSITVLLVNMLRLVLQWIY